jgi:signal transduction histidine kinase
LGLPIARALARNQGGDVRLGRSPLKGAAFVIEMPAASLPEDA